MVEGHELQQIFRALASDKIHPLHWRDQRSYFLATAAEFESGEGETGLLAVSGYLRGKPLNANQLVYLPGLGGFRIGKVRS